jgi:hypothetical protein
MRGCWSGTGAIAAREAPSAKAWLTGGTGIERIGDETISEGIQLVPLRLECEDPPARHFDLNALSADQPQCGCHCLSKQR